MDRVEQLALDAAKGVPHKRSARQQKRVSGTKVPRTDSGSDGSMMDVCCAATSDSAQSSLGPHLAGPAPAAAAVVTRAAAAAAAAAAADAGVPAPAPRRTDVAAAPDAEAGLVASEDFECSGSEVDGPVVDDRYIKGTRLVIGGWFQACRGCNEPTAHTCVIGERDVPLCPRCKDKYSGMISGAYPPNVGAVDTTVEPLSYWLPRMLGSMPRMEAAARKEFCDQLVLRQDDAWVALIKQSE